MKKLNLVAYATIAIFIFYGCKKSGSSSPKVSTWKVGNITYTGKITLFLTDSSHSGLGSVDVAENDIEVDFVNIAPKAGVYIVSDDPQDSAHCYVSMDIVNDTTLFNAYEPTSSSGGAVTLTISGGKRTATFTNISLTNIDDDTDVKIVSGTLIEK